ncbi:flagellar assembly peptidoglycan hydrolase FlgJ [Solimicrobium silvestre]|uniref:Peptidoglycan hydrolase FlgJ n=1 Tax=Solimicrobium silvestre TaxID=2099400 RepID=A0A2S9GVS3_9BURK|nr:flagellar assembly peptidoglycan hydrolase FlgJ [Solimicrobium silvestre]PRC91822.1 Flagellar rod assembly protein/muramidase FlgJ [Solimicrobium silvestre]
MTTPIDGTEKLAVDANSLNDLRRATNQNSPAGVKAAAKQFEALFVGMMLKSMRKAMPQDGPFDTEQSKMFTSMLDEQLSQKIAARGLGLAAVLEKQMLNNAALQYTSKHSTSVANPVPTSEADPTSITQHAQSLKAASPGLSNSQAQVQAFQHKLSGYAQQASQATGIPANFMLGQAALESGWGKHEIATTNGQPSHNLFGIKAGKNWTGKVVTAVTTEYCNGVATQKVEKFRCYNNYGEAFNDYANLLQGNQRYKNVLANAKDAYGFAQGLQKAGYASDPEYANKLMSVIAKTSST